MITRIGFAPRRPGLGVAEFFAHWAGNHGRVAGGLPGLKRYWQNHAVLENGAPLLPWTGFDACSDLDFESVEAMTESFKSDHYFSEVAPDEVYLVDKANGGGSVTRRVGPRLAAPAGVALLTFFRRSQTREHSALAAALQAAPTPGGAGARELFIALDPAEANGHVSAFDAIERLWFPDAAAARRYATSSEAWARDASFAGLVRGKERLIAEVKVIS